MYHYDSGRMMGKITYMRSFRPGAVDKAQTPLKRTVQAIYGNPSHNYGVSPAVWDHTVLPSTRHKRTHPTFTPAREAGTRFTDHLRMEG